MGRLLVLLFAIAALALVQVGCGCKAEGEKCEKNEECCSENCMKDALGAGPDSHCAPEGLIN